MNPSVNGSGGNGTVAPISDASINDLFPALVQCFGVILCGYFAGRFNLITGPQSKGIGTYITQFALPALFFRVMVTIDFTDVSWGFVGAVSVAKLSMHVVVTALVLLMSRPVNYSLAGILSTFVTQSNDVALGFPILNALYPKYASYIYLFAPAQLVVLNTISFMLMEWQTLKETDAKDKQLKAASSSAVNTSDTPDPPTPSLLKRFLLVMRNVFFNPLVFMTIIGVVFNFILNHKMPKILDKVLQVLADSFSGAALFYLGLGMVGKMGSLDRRGLYIVTFILLAKQVFMPFVTRELVYVFNPGKDSNETSTLSTVGFLYGGLPTAPPVYLFASQFQIIPEVIATGLVVGTFLFAPLMYVSARLVSLTVCSKDLYDALLSTTAFNVSMLSILSVMWVFAVFLLSRKFSRMPHQVTCFLLISFLLTCIGAVLGRAMHDNGYDKSNGQKQADWQHYLQFVIFFVGVTGGRVWTTMLTLTLVLLQWRSLCYLLRWRFVMYSLGICAPFFITGILLVSTKRQIVHEIDPIFQYGRTQLYVSLAVIVVNFVATSGLLIISARLPVQGPAYRLMNEDEVGSNVESEFVFDNANDPNLDTEENTRKLRRNRSNQSLTTTMTSSGVTDIEDWFESHTCPNGVCTPEQRRQCIGILGNYRHTQKIVSGDAENCINPEAIPNLKTQLDNYQYHRHLILIILLLISMIFGIFLCFWRLINETPTGVYIELEFLDSVFNFGQGFMAFCMFGLDTELIIIPFRRKFRQWMYGAEVIHLPPEAHLDREVIRTRSTFLRKHLHDCRNAIVRDQSRKLLHDSDSYSSGLSDSEM